MVTYRRKPHNILKVFALSLAASLAMPPLAVLRAEAIAAPNFISSPRFEIKPAKALDAADRTNQWIPIPSWLAGTWQSRMQKIVYYYDYKSRKAMIDAPIFVSVDTVSTRGLQRDGAGQIWQYTGVPALRVLEKPHFVEGQLLLSIELTESTADLVTTRSLTRIVRVKNGSNSVSDEFLEDETTLYERHGDGFITVTYLKDTYDCNGLPLNTSKCISTELRIKPFQVIEKDQRGDLHTLFQGFLKKRGQSPN